MEQERFLKIEVVTGLGERMDIDPNERRHNRNNWKDRYLTADCELCPFYVPPDELEKAIPSLRTSTKMRIRVPENPKGLCTVGQTEDSRHIIHKFLVENRYHRTQGCKNPSRSKRLERAEMRRREGKLRSGD